jgi:hypothetical protein
MRGLFAAKDDNFSGMMYREIELLQGNEVGRYITLAIAAELTRVTTLSFEEARETCNAIEGDAAKQIMELRNAQNILNAVDLNDR